jgi:DNA-binding LacI/PurR family transcriptional regulator
MHVTIKHVAKAAGVSPSTVSRVIANSPKISEATKARVFATLEAMHYKPNIIARSLANRVTYTLGLILPCKEEELFENPFFMQAMRGLSLYAQKKGYYIMYNYCRSEDEEVKTIEHYIDSKWVDGIILTATRIEDRCIELLLEYDHPFVVIGRPEEQRENILWVDNDNIGTMATIVQKLIDQGHKKIAFVGGEHQYTVYRHRLRGYKQALESNGIPYDENLVVEDDPTEEKAYQAMLHMLKVVVPDAIVGTDDLVAYGAYRAAVDSGYPQVAVAGFNNSPLSIYTNPTISTVDINAEKLGAYAAELLIKKLNKETMDDNHIIVETNYIERQSTLDHKST